MKTPGGRKPLFERLQKGMEQAIRHSRGEIALKTTAIELPDPPPTLRAEEVVRLRLDHAMSQAVLLACSTSRPKSCRAGSRAPAGRRGRLFD